MDRRWLAWRSCLASSASIGWRSWLLSTLEHFAAATEVLVGEGRPGTNSVEREVQKALLHRGGLHPESLKVLPAVTLLGTSVDAMFATRRYKLRRGLAVVGGIIAALLLWQLPVPASLDSLHFFGGLAVGGVTGWALWVDRLPRAVTREIQRRRSQLNITAAGLRDRIDGRTAYRPRTFPTMVALAGGAAVWAYAPDLAIATTGLSKSGRGGFRGEHWCRMRGRIRRRLRRLRRRRMWWMRGLRLMTPALGLGLGWRPETAGLALERTDLGFVEVISESVPLDASLPIGLQLLREQGTTVIPHGVSLGLGGAAPPSIPRLERMAAVAERLAAPLVSDHVAFVRANGLNAGHLLPLPRTRDSLDVLVANVRIAQSVLPVPLALEPIAALVAWPQPSEAQEIEEARFLGELVDRTGCLLLLDLANLHTNAATTASIPSSCWTACHWMLSRTCMWQAVRSATGCGTTRTRRRSGRRLRSSSASLQPGSRSPASCWSATTPTRRWTSSPASWTSS